MDGIPKKKYENPTKLMKFKPNLQSFYEKKIQSDIAYFRIKWQNFSRKTELPWKILKSGWSDQNQSKFRNSDKISRNSE